MSRLIWAPAALAILTLPLAAALPVRAQDALAEQTRLSLSAYGEVRAVPDMAQITLAVETSAATAAEAMARNRERMVKVMASLAKQGIKDRDVQTASLNLNAQYTYEPNLPPRLVGYQASNAVTVTVNDLSVLGRALDAVVSAGVNQVNGVSFGLKTPQLSEDEARKAAVKALQDKAALYALATGNKTLRLVSLSEGTDIAPSPRLPFLAMAKMSSDNNSTPIAAGELKVRVDISGVYALGH